MGSSQYQGKVSQELIDLLLLDQPDEEKVRLEMEKNGFEYKSDPVARMNLVLKALHRDPPQPNQNIAPQNLLR